MCVIDVTKQTMIRSGSPLLDGPSPQRRRIQEDVLVWKRFVDQCEPHPLLVLKEQPNCEIFENIMSKYKGDGLIVRNKERLEAIKRNLDSRGWVRRVELHQKPLPFPESYAGCRQISRSYGQDLTYLPCKVLNTLYHDTHACIDMVNSHFTILLNFFGHLDIPHIKDYVTNRDAVIDIFVRLGLSGSEVKKAHLSMIGACPKLPSDFGLGGISGNEEKIRILSENAGIMGMATEIKKCFDQIRVDYPDYVAYMTEHALREGKSDHRAGVALSHFCFDVEDSMMRVAIKTLQDQYEDDVSQDIVWKFDGAVVPRTMVHDGEDALRRVQTAIHNELGLHIKFSFKPLNFDIYPECAAGFQINPYRRFQKEFEKTYFKVLEPPSYARMMDGRVQLLGKDDWRFLHAEKDEKMVKQWEQDPDKLCYSKICSYPPPLIAPFGVKNTWNGFDAEQVVVPMDDGELDRRWALWEKHVEIMAGHEPVAMEWIHKILAHIIQKPGIKTEKIIFIRSIPGVGKDMFTDFILGMLGSVAVKFDGYGQLSTQWSAILQNKIMAVVTEVNYKDFEVTRRAGLKAMTTRKIFYCVDKGEKGFITNCYLNMILFTNDFGGMNMSNLDRRFVCCQSDSRYACVPEYHIPLAAYVEDKMNQVAVFRKYKKMDISNMNIYDQVVTKVHKEMSSLSVGGQNIIPSFFKYEDNFSKWQEIAEGRGNSDYQMLGRDFLQIASSSLAEELVGFYANLQWSGCEKVTQAAQILGRNIAEADAQASKHAPANIKAIEKTRKRSPGMNPRFVWIFHIPTIGKWMAEMLSDDTTVEADGPLPDAFRA
jgi:hypothetical protein